MTRTLVVLAALLLVAGCGRAERGESADGPADATTSSDAVAESSTTTVEAAQGEPVPSGVTRGEIEVDGMARTYRLFVPSGLTTDDSVPLLVGLHGGGGSGQQYATSSGWEEVAERERFVAVFPDGTGPIPTWNAGECCGFAAREDVDDVGLMAALIDQLADEMPIDTDSVVATGHSNGSTMSYRLACELADEVVAIGMQAAPLTFERCAPSEPVSVLHVHGADDPNVPVGGGVGSRGISGLDWPAVREGVDTMAAASGCEPDPQAETTGGVTTTTWSGCDDDTEVEMVIVAGGGHGWMRPGGSGQRGDSVDVGDFDSTETIWAFLSRQLGE